MGDKIRNVISREKERVVTIITKAIYALYIIHKFVESTMTELIKRQEGVVDILKFIMNYEWNENT